MANAARGEVEVRDSEGRTYTFRLATGAICAVEEALNLDITEVFELLKRGRIRVTWIREFVKAASVDKPNQPMSNDDAHAIIDSVGATKLLDVFTDCILATFNARQGKQAKANPQRARARRSVGSAESSSAPPKKES